MSDTRELESQLRSLARAEHSDLSIAEEAADALAAMRAEIAGLRAYALALKDATLPFCAIRANDNDNFNGYAPETVIRCEITVGELVKLRLCAGCGQPQAGCFVNSTPLPAAPKE